MYSAAEIFLEETESLLIPSGSRAGGLELKDDYYFMYLFKKIAVHKSRSNKHQYTYNGSICVLMDTSNIALGFTRLKVIKNRQSKASKN